MDFMFEKSTIPIRKLDRSRVHHFKYQPGDEELAELAANNGWRKLEIDEFGGELTPNEEGWELNAHLLGTLTQFCVISGAPVKFALNLELERIYHSQMPELPKDLALEDDTDVNIEPLPKLLDLNTLISEEILLEAPDYPRLKKYDQEAIWEYDPVDNEELQEERKASPFADLDKRLSQKD